MVTETIDTSRIKAFPANTNTINVQRIQVTVAATAYQGPDMSVEDGFALVIKSDPTNAAAGLIYVGSSASTCLNPNTAWALVLNESVAYFITNANQVYVSGNSAGDNVLFTIEKRRSA